ncbi:MULTISPECIES: peptidase [unclassified Streptomyces]|uniref:peptidase n=1 Tax=unclassified Streptomyces TaxID=2593676 RepID=UPI0036C8F3D7
MKIRRILATAVAAAVTTPVVFLSAGPAFATPTPTPAQTQAPATHEDGEKPSLEELEEAVDKARAKVAELEAQRKAVLKDLDETNIDEALKTELAAAKEALKTAEDARTAADAALAAAEDALKKLPGTATEQEKADAEKAVADAKKAVEGAAATLAAAKLRHGKADTAFDDAVVALAKKAHILGERLKLAKQELADARDALEGFEELPEECEEGEALAVQVTGPTTVTAGTSAVFSLKVRNTSERTLDAVEAYAFAATLPTDWEEIDENEEPPSGWNKFITVEWSSAKNPAWSRLSEEFDGIELGALAKGGQADVKLRLTVDAKTPTAQGVAFAAGAYENEDGSCGFGDNSEAFFDIVPAGKDDKPAPTPTPSPSTTTATPTPVPTVTTGNTNTTPQGGSSTTPVNRGTLAATGSGDHLPQLGLAAGAAVVLGAGALVVARRRKAGAGA